MASPLLTVTNVTAHPSTASVPITVLLHDGLLLCGFREAIKGLSNQNTVHWRHNLGNASDLSQSRSRCSVQDNNSNDKDWNVGCKRHHPTNHLCPCWVRIIAIFHRLVARKAEYQDQLRSHIISVTLVKSLHLQLSTDILLSTLMVFVQNLSPTLTSRYNMCINDELCK